MRYSRFRSAMLGLEPQRRNRPAKEKPNRITKSKKDPKAKKEDGLKSESVADSASVADSTESPIPNIKQESVQPSYGDRLTPATLANTPTASLPHVIQPRLLTPCSDTDAFATSHGLTSSPASEMMNSQASFDFPGHQYGHDHTNWQHPTMYNTFESPFEFDAFPMGCGHPHMHHHHAEDHTMPPPMDETEAERVNVKHENWDNHCI
jgi:hypothetical protein